MSDHMKKVRTGDPLAIPAQAYNAFIDATLDYQQRTRHVGQKSTPGSQSSGIVLVKNVTGSALSRFHVVGLGDPVIGPLNNEQQFKNTVAFRGETPSVHEHEGRFAVVLEPLAAGGIGRAVVSGVAIVRVADEFTHEGANVDDVGARFADVAHDMTGYLITGRTGSAEILWRETGIHNGAWAVVRLGASQSVGFWARIESVASDNGGQYANWTEVECVGFVNEPSWQAADGGLTGATGWKLMEASGAETVPAKSIVFARPNPAYNGTQEESKYIFQYEPEPEWIGFGVPTGDDVPYGATIPLTVTDSDGTPILDGDDAEQTITVWKNAAGRALYTHFDDGPVFAYVRFPQETTGGIGGCIFSRTEAFKSHGDWLPEGGYSLHAGEQPPATTDITGDPGNEEHCHVIGKMFMEADDDGKGWAPWFAIDPEALGSAKVKTDAADETPGYLDDEIQVGQTLDQTHTWLTKTVVDESVDQTVDNKLRLHHTDWDSANTTVVGNMLGIDVAGDNVQILDAIETPPADSAWFDYYEYEDEYDVKMHGRVRQRPTKKKLVIELPDAVDEKVKASDADPTAGYLDAKITSGDHWMTVTPGPSSITLAHNTIGSLNNDTYLSGPIGGGNGVSVAIAAPADGSPYITGNECVCQWDDKGHGQVIQTGNTIYCSLPCVVRADAADTAPGYLATKITTDPGDGSTPALQTSVIPGGAANNKLLIEHIDWDAVNADAGEEVSNVLTLENMGGGATLDIAEPVPGYAWIHIDIWKHQQDVKGHCDLLPRQGATTPIYIKWVAVPEGAAGDMLYWSNGQWTLLPAPASLSVLVNDGSSPRWEPVEEFACPGST